MTKKTGKNVTNRRSDNILLTMGQNNLNGITIFYITYKLKKKDGSSTKHKQRNRRNQDRGSWHLFFICENNL
jgi:hypothetical protein